MSKKRGFLGDLGDSVRGALFNDVPAEPDQNDTAEETAAPPPLNRTAAKAPAPINMSPVPTFSTTMVGQIDPEKYKKLQDAMYPKTGALASFLTTLQAMRSVILDEGTAFRAVIASLQAQGSTVDQIFGDLQAMEGRVVAEIARIAEKRKLETQTGVTDKEKRVQDLNNQIEKLTKERDGLVLEAHQAKTEIQQRSSNFDAAIAALRTEFGDIQRKLQMYTAVAANGGTK